MQEVNTKNINEEAFDKTLLATWGENRRKTAIKAIKAIACKPRPLMHTTLSRFGDVLVVEAKLKLGVKQNEIYDINSFEYFYLINFNETKRFCD